MGLAVPAVGEVPGAEVLGEEDGGTLPLHEGFQRFPGEGFALSGPGGEAEVHPQPLNVQGQTTGPSRLGGGLLKVLGEAAAGDGGAEQGHGAGDIFGVALRQVQRPPGGGQRRGQRHDKGPPVPAGSLLEVQQHAGVVPPPALPQHGVPKAFRTSN